MNLSDVFKFTQGLGQRGHQIGRKVGDAIELLTLGMINLDSNLSQYLQIEKGIEGATSAKHKVEFAFYNSDDLFGLIECKKVGVEQTTKSNFKTWHQRNTGAFYSTEGYKFTIDPSGFSYKWDIHIKGSESSENNIEISISKKNQDTVLDSRILNYNCNQNSQILFVLDVDMTLHTLGPGELLSAISSSISKCIILQITELEGNLVKTINVNDSLPGPQTPEKAKQASFVSLDVRKRILGHFDKTEDKSFVSILVIGEASHWEDKSRSMIRLCNDHNLIIPDEVLVDLFRRFENQFGTNYQDKITKTNYNNNPLVAEVVTQTISHFHTNILQDMDTHQFVKFGFQELENKKRLIVENIHR